MNLGMAENPVKFVLDTNILISAFFFRSSNPRQILDLANKKRIKAITSPILVVELIEVIQRKFPALSKADIKRIEAQVEKDFEVVKPTKFFDKSRDEDDNRVLEAAIEGGCKFIITGDRDLLDLIKFKDVQIVTPNQFLEILKD